MLLSLWQHYQMPRFRNACKLGFTPDACLAKVCNRGRCEKYYISSTRLEENGRVKLFQCKLAHLAASRSSCMKRTCSLNVSKSWVERYHSEGQRGHQEVCWCASTEEPRCCEYGRQGYELASKSNKARGVYLSIVGLQGSRWEGNANCVRD